MSDDLDVTAHVSTPSGMLNINDGSIYRLGADTLAGRQVQYRRQEAISPYTPGTWTVNAVPDNIIEVVQVQVFGADHKELRERLADLEAAFTQFSYTITWDVDNDAYAWHCQIADYQVDTRREFQHSRMAIATFQVPRYPALLAVFGQ